MDNNFNDLRNTITKQAFDNILVNKKNKELKKFINEVKKSEILKKQLDIYSIVEHEKFDDKEDAKFYLDKNLQEFKEYTTKEIEEENKRIVEAFGYTFNNSDHIYNIIQSLYAKDSKRNSKVTKDFRKLYEGMVTAKPVITEEKVEQKVTKKEINRAIEIINETYSFFNETEKKIFKSFIKKDESGKEVLYNDLLNENINLVKRKIFESEDPLLENKLKEIESKLIKDKYSYSKKIDDYVKLIDLNKNLQ